MKYLKQRRIKQLYRFTRHIRRDTLSKAYRVAIEPIAIYATEILYENFSCNTVKKFNALEIAAIKMEYRLPRQTPTIDCLDYLKDGGIAERLQKRRDNFIQKNKSSPLIRHGETLKYSQGRRIRIKRIHKDRSLRHKGCKSKLVKTLSGPSTAARTG